MCGDWAANLGASTRTGLTFAILPSLELVIYSEVTMSCFNHSLNGSLTLSSPQFGQEPSPTRQGTEGIFSSSSSLSGEVTDDPDMV